MKIGRKKGTRPARVIKRYSNRKLYDTAGSRYVTLEEIADLLRDGEDVKVIDNVTKEDLTALTLTQIILETERHKNIMPLQFLRSVICSGGLVLREYFQKTLPSTAANLAKQAEGGLTNSVEEFQKFLNAQFGRILQSINSISGLKGKLGILEEKLRLIEDRLKKFEK